MFNYRNRVALNWQLLKSSFKFLGRNKDLLVFPIISLISTVALFVSAIGTVFFKMHGIKQTFNSYPIEFIVLIFLCYFVLGFITLLLNKALLSCVIKRLQNEKATLLDGLHLVASHTGTLIGWSIISSTVGCIISALENSHRIIEEIISIFLGAGWTIGTYFVIPILIFENVGPFAAIKRSFNLLGRGWRKIVNVNLIFFLMMLATFCVIYTLGYILPQGYSVPVLFAAIILWWLVASTFGKTFSTIVNSALYLNITKNFIPDNFDKSLLEQSFIKKGMPLSPQTFI